MKCLILLALSASMLSAQTGNYDPVLVTPKVQIEQPKNVKKSIKDEQKFVADMRKEQEKARQKVQKILAEFSFKDAQVLAWENSVRAANGWDNHYSYDRKQGVWIYQPTPEPQAAKTSKGK